MALRPGERLRAGYAADDEDAPVGDRLGDRDGLIRQKQSGKDIDLVLLDQLGYRLICSRCAHPAVLLEHLHRNAAKLVAELLQGQLHAHFLLPTEKGQGTGQRSHESEPYFLGLYRHCRAERRHNDGA